MAWTDRTPGTWELYQFVEVGSNGSTHVIGEFPSYRAAAEAARRIAKISNLKGEFSTSFCRSHKREGSVVDGRTRHISIDGPTEYDPDIELRLSNGKVVWLGDVDAALCLQADVTGVLQEAVAP